MDPARDRALRWAEKRTYHHRDFPGLDLARLRRDTVSVCAPARNEARTIEGVVRELVALRDHGVIDEAVVVDAGSEDGTAELAARAGATVYQESELMPELGPALGKGDAMYRALSVLKGDVICFVDSDSAPFLPHYATGVIGPLLTGPDRERLHFVKGFFQRPFTSGGVSMPAGGGRVTELAARPVLNLFWPELAGVRQPLAGEMAGRRELFMRVPWACGYAVETALLLDVFAEVGLEGIAQVDLEVRQNDHQPLHHLTRMASAVLEAAQARLERDGRLTGGAIGRGAVLAVDTDRGGFRYDRLESVERAPHASRQIVRS